MSLNTATCPCLWRLWEVDLQEAHSILYAVLSLAHSPENGPENDGGADVDDAAHQVGGPVTKGLGTERTEKEGKREREKE